MAARAMWKGVVKIGANRLPVKLYSAVQDRKVHFRLLHRSDKEPVKQQLVSSESGEEIEQADVRKALPLNRSQLVVFDDKELEELEPKESRDVEIERFVAADELDHRFYERAYYLGPDGNAALYFAAVEALERKKKEGIAQWTMRKKSYVGSLRAENGYLMLITLRHAEEIISAEALEPPAGRALDKREVEMATQLIDALTGRFDPAAWEDDYRKRVMELIETKSKGRKPKVAVFRPKKTDEGSLAKALEASLKGMKKASGG